MDDEDFLSELGITSKAKTTPNGAAVSGNKQGKPAPLISSGSARLQSNAITIDTDIGKRKKKTQQKHAGLDDMKWLSGSPQESHGGGIETPKSVRHKPLALQEDGTVFEPLAPHDRFHQYATAFEGDDADFSVNLAEEMPFVNLAKKKIKPEETALRFIASWKRACGGNLGDAKMTPRTASFLSSLVLYHDPELWAHLADLGFDYATASLYECYAPSDPRLTPILELWDASIMNNLAGFETPTQGSLMFGLALFLLNRDIILQSKDNVDAVINQLRTQTDPVKAVIVGCRAAKLTPDYFVRLLGEIELNWKEYDDVLSGESNRSPASPVLTAQQPSASAIKPNEVIGNSTTANGALTQSTSSVTAQRFSSWMDQMRTTASSITAASMKEGLNQFTQKVSDALQGTLDDDETPRARHNHIHRRPSATGENRHLFLVEYPGVRRLGLQLGQTANGLTVAGFDRTQRTKGEAEEEGTVKIGDTMHSVNWVSVAVLPAAIAGKVLAKQERPLHITYSTTNFAGRKLPGGLSPETRAIQHSLLRARLLSFYERFGQEKVDDIVTILRLYSTHEKALVRGLYCKYGEPVPGDCSFKSELVLLSASEALIGGLAREDEADVDDFVFVDIRTPEERQDTGILPLTFCLSFDDKDDAVIKSINRAVMSKQNKTKVCLLGSGTHRMFSLVDPARAAEEKGNERERLMKAARKLAGLGFNGICAIRGGFTECVREAHLRQTPLVPGVHLKDCGQGLIFRACEAYAALEYKDTESLGRFIVGYFTDFKEPVLAANERSSSSGYGKPTVSDSSSSSGVGSRNSTPQDGLQNIQAAFSSLSTVSVQSLFKPTSSNNAMKASPAKPFNEESIAIPQAVFSIDDD